MFTSTARRIVVQAPRLVRTAATAPAKKTWGSTYKRPAAQAQAATSSSASTAAPKAAAAEHTAAEYEEATRVQDQQYDDVPSETMADAPPPSPIAFTPSSAGAAAAPSSPFATSPFPSTPIPLQQAALSYAQQQATMDWATSFHGISSAPFSEKAAEILMRDLTPAEIEIKPDGLLYLPEILYRRILNKAFGPGGWGMVPRGEMTVSKGMVSREWGLWVGGRLVSIARGEQTYFDPSGLPTATEGCKSNALMRCCKDLGIASELWDPGFIRVFKAQHCVEAWTEHGSTKKKQKRWRKKGNKFEYPLKEAST